MNIKLLAALDTLKLVAFGVGGAALAHLALMYFSADALLMGLGVAFVAFMVYLFYSINLARRTYQQIRNEGNSKSES